jgi:hypothetical protein
MLRLSEKPLEWVKFTAVIGLAVNVVLGLIWWRGSLPGVICLGAAGLALVAIVTASIHPHRFRGFYRRGMTVSFQIGQIMGRILLTIFFFLIVTPMGLLLRLLGKDLLRLKKTPGLDSYWQKAKDNRNFDRMH